MVYYEPYMTEQSALGTQRILYTVLTAITLLTVTPFTTLEASFEKPSDIEKKVKVAFADAPVMIHVAKCESGFRQFYDSGNVFRGSSKYIGIFQIDENLHRNPASAIGYDIYTVDGNIGYARHLYTTQGATPWRNCSNQYYGTVPQAAAAPVVIATQTAMPQTLSTPAAVFPITRDLQFGSRGVEVTELQKILNAHGYPIAQSGPGSAGFETTYYGELTKKAVESFQCAKTIACAGAPGFGIVGPATRTALQALYQ